MGGDTTGEMDQQRRLPLWANLAGWVRLCFYSFTPRKSTRALHPSCMLLSASVYQPRSADANFTEMGRSTKAKRNPTGLKETHVFF